MIYKIIGTVLPAQRANALSLMADIGLLIFFDLILGFILIGAFLLAVIGVLWHRYIVIGLEGPIINRLIVWYYMI